MNYKWAKKTQHHIYDIVSTIVNTDVIARNHQQCIKMHLNHRQRTIL